MKDPNQMPVAGLRPVVADSSRLAKKRFSAKHWTLTIRICDGLAIAALLFGGYLTWSIYQLSGKFTPPVHSSMLLNLAVFLVIRGIAAKERRKAMEAESQNPVEPPDV